MPQARSAGSSASKPAKPAPAKSEAAKKPAAAKPAASKSATTKTSAARSTGAKRTSGRASAAKPAAAGTASSRAGATKASAAKSSAAKASTAKTSSGAAGSAKAAAGSKSRVRVHVKADSAQIDAIAERVRKLNEKIIEIGRDAGESTLASYEKALKSIATSVSKSSAKDEVEWITNLASSQAKFVRDITDSWAKAARERLK